MGQSVVQVDAFADRPFAGNPAAVCVLSEPADERWMALVAREMNLSETAFVSPRPDGYALRWFTPTVEVDLCGHATLASAHVLWEDGHLPADAQARFHTRSGLLTANRRGAWIELDLPAMPMAPVDDATAVTAVARALGVAPLRVVWNRRDYLVEVNGEGEVRAVQPDLAALRALPVDGVVVTSRAASAGFDFVSRYFAPSIGIDEDPVTGYAHCCLGPYWRGRLRKDAFVAYQASARGGVVQVRVDGDRVNLGGQAITVLRGEILC